MKERDIDLEQEGHIVVGLDIGTTKIVAVVGTSLDDGTIEVMGYGHGKSKGVEHGLIMNLIHTTDSIISAVGDASEAADVEINSVYAGIAARHINSSTYRHTIMRRNGRDEIIARNEIEQMSEDIRCIDIGDNKEVICVIPQNFTIDGQRNSLDPVGELGTRLDGYFQIISGRKDEIGKVVRCIKDSNLEVEEVILEPLASGLSCLTDEQKQQGAIIIDMGGGTTDVAIYRSGKTVFTKVIPIGAYIITKDIATVCNVTEEVAEKLKHKYGTCIVDKANKDNIISLPQIHNSQQSFQLEERYLADIIYTRVYNDILIPVRDAIRESGHGEAMRRGIGVVLTGGGSKLRHIKELCTFTLGLNTEIGIPNVGFSGLPASLKDPMFSTSLGLVKHGIDIAIKEGIELRGTSTKRGPKKATGNEKTGKERAKSKGQKEKNDSGENVMNKAWDTIANMFKGFTEKMP